MLTMWEEKERESGMLAMRMTRQVVYVVYVV